MPRRLIYFMVAFLIIVLLALFARGRGLLPSVSSLPGIGALIGDSNDVTIESGSNGPTVTVQGQEIGVRPSGERLVLERERPSGQVAVPDTPTPVPVEPTAQPAATDVPAAAAPTQQTQINTPAPAPPTALPQPTATNPPVVVVQPTNTAIPPLNSAFITFRDHTVQEGDTIVSIAEQYNTDVTLMTQYSNFNSLIYPGQVVRVPILNPAACNGQIHVVATGQNVFRLAIQYDTTKEAIQATNGLGGDYLIKIGQALCIPN